MNASAVIFFFSEASLGSSPLFQTTTGSITEGTAYDFSPQPSTLWFSKSSKPWNSGREKEEQR